MDHVLSGSITAVREFGIGDPELWFTLIVEVYQELESSEWGPDFVDFTARFTDRATMEGLRAAAEEFVRYAEANGGIELVRQAHDEGVANLVYEFERLLAEAADSATAQAQESELGYAYDEAAWNAFLPEFGAQWNGDEAAWAQFVEWFLYHAEDRSLAEPATAFVEYADVQPDRVAVFAAYGIDIAGSETAAEPEPVAELDMDAWEAFLAHVGSDWNGDEAAWPQFVEWFLHHARVQGLESVATGFIQYAEGEADKIGFFARYGITVTPAEEEDLVAVAQRRIETVVAASPTIAEEHVPLLAGTLAELLIELPEAALLPDDQLQQLVEEIAAEHL